MKLLKINSVTAVILRVKLLDSSVTTGAGLAGLTSASAGLLISTIADLEATATAYAQASSKIESITTLGTFATPTATKCRFKEVDATNHPGVYEIQLANARFAVTSATSLLISISGATNLAQYDAEIQTETIGADAQQLGSSATAAANMARTAPGILYFTAATGTLSTTQFTSGITTYSDGNLVGRAGLWLTGNNKGLPFRVSGYTSSGGLVTMSGEMGATVANGDTGVM